MHFRNAKGLSIMEILVALFMASILFTVAARAVSSGGKGLATILSHSELLEDTRYAGEIIHSNLQNSVYVYPPQTELTLNTNAEYHTRNPRTSSNKWLIGTDPIIAMIVAPKTTATTCPTDPNACLSFFAYYTVKRSEVTSATGLRYTGGALPEDSNNPDALMIFEYQKTLNVRTLDDGIAPPITHQNDTPAGQLKDVTARLVADYINPAASGFQVNLSFCKPGPNPCAADSGLAPRLHYENSIISGNIILSSLFSKGRKTYETPELDFSFNPRNLY